MTPSVGDTGLEPTPETPRKTAFSETGGAESGAVAARGSDVDPDLCTIITAWPSLSRVTQQVVIQLVEADPVEENDSR